MTMQRQLLVGGRQATGTWGRRMGYRLGWEAMSKIETLSRQGSIEGLEGSDQIYVFKRLSGCFSGNRLKLEAHREHHSHPSEHVTVLGVGGDGRWAHAR